MRQRLLFLLRAVVGIAVSKEDLDVKRLLFVLVTALALAVNAFADAISVSPLEVIEATLPNWLPWLLIVAVVVITALVVRKRRK